MKTKKIYLLVATITTMLLSACSLNDFQATYQSYAITVSATDGGTVTGDNPSIVYNSNITVRATSNVGYVFNGWYEGTVKVSPDSVYTFTVKGDCDLVAHFKDIRAYTITLNQVGDHFQDETDWGTVTGAGDYMNHTAVQLVATSAVGYYFGGWYTKRNDINSLAYSDSTYSIVCIQDTTLYAMFIAKKYNLTLTTNPAAGGIASGEGSYSYNTAATLNAVATTGYRFGGFYDEEVKLASTSPFALTITENSQIEARFVKTWMVHVSDDGDGIASINNGGVNLVVDNGTSVSFNATPKSKYYFAGWYNGNTAVSPNNPYTISVTGNVNLHARFTSNPQGTGTITDWTNVPIDGGTIN